MKRGFTYIFTAIIALTLMNTNAAAESAAFALFKNESANESFNYLEKILPNSFATALKKKYGFSITKPAQISTLSAEENDGILREIKEEELLDVTKDINADYFIYGSFKPLDDNKIKLTISVYKKGAPDVFQFEDTGYLETEIFKLVDKIADKIKNIANESMIYKNEKIEAKSKLAIITNVEGNELNSVYYDFLSSGYKLSPTQGNEIYSLIDNEQIKKFYHFSGANASFHFIHNRKDADLFHGTWSGVNYYKTISEDKKVYEDYSYNYEKTKNEFLKKIRAFNTDSIDYLLIIGFDENRSCAWIRCLNLKDNRLVITESGIKGSSMNDITKNIIKSITTGLPVPEKS